MWQPIETAPKDGTEFLAYDSKVGKFDVCHMRQYAPGDRWFCDPVQFDGEYGPLENEFGYETNGITHWMPLPEPPKWTYTPTSRPAPRGSPRRSMRCSNKKKEAA